MLNNSVQELYWTTNKNAILGYEPGELVVWEYHCGGGFSGAPQILNVAPVMGIAPGQPVPQPADWPHPCTGIEYRVGGRLYAGYHYYHEGRAR